MTCTEIGNKFNLYPGAVRTFLSKRGVKIRPKAIHKGMTPWNKNKKIGIKEITRKKFEAGKLSNRGIIYNLLVERDGNKCTKCGIVDWNNQPIRLWVDHIDGNPTNNMPYNFRLVCPNCDSQSSTYSNRNKGNGRTSRGIKPYQ
jgi:hypothetical protein